MPAAGNLCRVWNYGYKKHLNEELETAISIITSSYLRTEDLIRAVKENLPYINEPVKANFEVFVYEAELIFFISVKKINIAEKILFSQLFQGAPQLRLEAGSMVSGKVMVGCTTRPPSTFTPSATG